MEGEVVDKGSTLDAFRLILRLIIQVLFELGEEKAKCYCYYELSSRLMDQPTGLLQIVHVFIFSEVLPFLLFCHYVKKKFFLSAEFSVYSYSSIQITMQDLLIAVWSDKKRDPAGQHSSSTASLRVRLVPFILSDNGGRRSRISTGPRSSWLMYVQSKSTTHATKKKSKVSPTNKLLINLSAA